MAAEGFFMAYMSIGFVDYGGTRRRTGVHLQDGAALADYQLGGELIIKEFDDVTGCLFTDAFIQIPITPPGTLKGSAVVGEEAERGALLSFDTAGLYSYGLWVPGVKQALIAGEGLNTGHADITALVAVMVTGTGGLGGLVPHNGHDEDITALLRGAVTFRRK